MSRNLVNGDSLKKYHIGINTPNISEELINENVTSFKVGTSNVNGTDLTNQMEQSLVDITYIEGNVIDRDWKLNPTIVAFDSGEKELYSLQDRFYDEYKDGKLHKRIRKLTNEDFDIEKAICGSNAGWNIDGNTYGFYFQNCGSDCIDDTGVDCNLFRYNGELVSNDTPGVAVSGEWGWIGFRVNKTTLGIISSDGNVQKLQKAKEWLRRTYIEVYYLVNETITDESITILANPNEEINVVNGTPTIIKHTIQLNTKSQVEKTQKQIVKNNKSIWRKFKELTERFKELTDVEIRLEQDGYIKLPTALSGLILQWGSFHVVGANNINWFGQNVIFPKPMSKICTIQCSVDSLGTWDASKGVKALIDREGTNTTGTKFIIYSPDNTSTTLRWFAIGR